MKPLSALPLLASFTTVSLAQIPQSPGIPPAGQAQQAFAVVQAQSMMMTNQAQLQGLIASQAAMLSSFQARSIFLTEAASLQARMAMNQGTMFATQAAAISAMQRSRAIQKQLHAQSVIPRMRSLGDESAPALERAVQLASLDPVKMSRRTAVLHAVAAQTSGQTSSVQSGSGQIASGQTAAQPPFADAGSLPVEPPPMMIRPTFGNALAVEKPMFSVESGTVSAGT